jgi:hypothetical protein
MILAAGAVTMAAAARSTWSPCGLSMLASITPLSEAGRGHRYRTTATWFVLGALVGGAVLGVVVAVLAVGVRAMSLTTVEIATIALAGSTAAALSDIGRSRFRLPIHRRQVNERWLDQFRPWVYGAGFGAQIGAGLATYIVTAAVYLMILLAALTGNRWGAVAIGTLFGLVRGLSVLLGRRITSGETLRIFHLRFQDLGPKIRLSTIAVELAAVALFAWELSPWVAVGLVVGAVAWGLAWLRTRLDETSTPVEDIAGAAFLPSPIE